MPNKALDFDGASGLVTVSDATAIQNIFDGGGTIECWINVDSDGEADHGLIAFKLWLIRTTDEASSKVKIEVSWEFNTARGYWKTTATEVTINTWTHLVITYNADSVDNNPLIYIQGASVGVTEVTAPEGTRSTDVGSNLIIGNQAGDDRTFDGTIDEMRLYTRILGSTEITANYNGGAGRYWPSDFRNLVAWWHMDEGAGSSIYDQTNRGNTGTITSASWVNGFDFLIQKDVPRR